MTAAWRRVLAILAIFLGVFLCGRALLLALALSDYLTAVLLCAAALVPLYWLWRRLLRAPRVQGVHYAVVVMVLVVMVVLVRGGVGAARSVRCGRGGGQR